MPDGRVFNLSTDFISGKKLDAGNSGTTARLLSGLIAGHELYSTIDGDSSLRRRPMTRVSTPLAEMGAEVSTAEGGRLPMTIRGGNLKGIDYRLPVPSAQVKTTVLIAGLLAEGSTTVEEGIPTRDHTERMLRAMSASIHAEDGRITVEGGCAIQAVQVKVPALVRPWQMTLPRGSGGSASPRSRHQPSVPLMILLPRARLNRTTTSADPPAGSLIVISASSPATRLSTDRSRHG